MFPNNVQYLGPHWDPWIKLGLEEHLSAPATTGNGLTFLFQNNHLTESQRWLNELLNAELYINHHNRLKLNTDVRSVNHVLHQHFDHILSDLQLRPPLNAPELIPDKYLCGEMRTLKRALGVGDRFDKPLRRTPINVTDVTFPNSIDRTKPNRLSSCSLLWMDMFELALFALSQDYVRLPQMGVMSDPYGAVLGLILKASLHRPDMDIHHVSRLNRALILEQWSRAQAMDDTDDPRPFINDFALWIRQKFFSADPFTISRIFTVSQVVMHQPRHGESLWKHTINLVQRLPEAEYQLIDFEAWLDPSDRCYQMYSHAIQALSHAMTTKGAADE